MDNIVTESKPAEPLAAEAVDGEGSRRGQETILVLLLIAGTLALYNPATRNGFINYDDNSYITLNPHVQAGLTLDGMRWAFTTFDVSNWHPITWLSHMLDCQLFGLNPAGHHFVSILLHALNVALVFWLLLQATGAQWRGLWVAALFAVHPINVESVAWVAERKNVLSTLFGLLTIAAYGWYVRQRNWKRYSLMGLLFALSLLAKPMLVTLPFALLLLDLWPLKRLASLADWRTLRRLILEKAPLMVFSVASSIITMKAQRSSMGAMVWKDPGVPRFFSYWNAIYSYPQYLRKMFWPSKLAIFYPLHSIEFWQVVLSALLLGVVTLLVLRAAKQPYLAVGWLWFLGMLVPVIGIVSVGRQAMADRYAYVPLLGIFVLLVWGVADLAERLGFHLAVIALPLAAITALGVVTHNQLPYWHDSISLFTHVLAVTQHNYSAHVNLGGALDREGRSDEALQQYYAAQQDNPRYGTAAYDIAVQMQKRGRLRDAIHYYESAIALTQNEDPDLVSHTYSNLGQVHAFLGEQPAAKTSFEKALALDPLNFSSNLGLAKILVNEGEPEPAVKLLGTALNILPTAEGYYYLGLAWEEEAQSAQAKAAYRHAVELDPNLEAAQKRLKAIIP